MYLSFPLAQLIRLCVANGGANLVFVSLSRSIRYITGWQWSHQAHICELLSYFPQLSRSRLGLGRSRLGLGGNVRHTQVSSCGGPGQIYSCALSMYALHVRWPPNTAIQ